MKRLSFLENVFLNVDLFLLVFLITLTVIIGFLLIVFIRFRRQYLAHHKLVQQRINYYLVYRINLKLDVVYEFDPRHPENERTIPVTQFLKYFSPVEAEKLYQWWGHLLAAKMDTPWIFTTKMQPKRRGRNQQIIFEVIKIEENKQAIHLHRFGLKYLKPQPQKFSSKQVIVSSQQALQIVKKLAPKQGGLFSLHMIFPRTGLDEQFKYFYLSQIKEKILPYLSPQLIMIDTAQDILLLSTKNIETHVYLEIAQTLSRVVSQYVEVNALEALLKFNLAVIEHKHSPNDLRGLIRKVKELNLLMVKQKLAISAYDKHQPITETLAKNELQFTENFYHKLQFELVYRPFVHVFDRQVVGYQLMILPKTPTSLTTFELLNEAPLMVNYTKDFFRRYFALIQQTLVNQPQMLLTPFSLAIKLNEFLPEIKTLSQTDQLLIFLDEFEVKELAFTLDSLKTWADPFKQMRVKFALALDDVFLSMPEEMYHFFDYFVIDYRRFTNAENDQKTAIQLKLIFQNFIRLEKPILVHDLVSEAGLDLIPLKHVKIIAADWMMSFQHTLDSPSKRQLNRLQQIVNKKEQVYGKTN